MLLLIGFSFPLIMHCRELPKVTTQCICNKLSSLCFPLLTFVTLLSAYFPPSPCYSWCCPFVTTAIAFLLWDNLRRSKSYLANPLRTYLLRSKVTRETCHDTAKIQILTRSLTVFTPLLCQNTLVLENVSGIMYLYVDVPKCKIQQLMLLSVLLMYLRQVFTGGVMHW